MNITVHFSGALAEWITETASFDLESDAVYADLVKEIGKRFGQKIPKLWNEETSDFTTPVIALGIDKRPKNHNTSLVDGEEITVYLMLAGG